MDGYRARITPQAGQPLPSASPEVFGAGVAASLEKVGQAAHQREVQSYLADRRLRENSQQASFAEQFAKARADMNDERREGRKSDDPGHAERLREKWEEKSAELLDGIEFEDLRERNRAALTSWGSEFVSREADWEDLRQADLTKERFGEALSTAANRTRRLEDPQDYTDEIKAQYAAIDGFDLSDGEKTALRKETDRQLGIGYIQGWIDRDPQGALAAIQSGAFDDAIPPAQIEALINSAGVEIRRKEAQAAQAKAQAQSEFRERVRSVKELDDQGIDITGQLPDLIAEAQANGMTDLALELEGMSVTAEFGRQYEGATPALLQQRLAVLRGKAKPSISEQRETKWIEERLPGIEQRFDSDPAGYLLRDGGAAAPPPIDFADPASLARRGRWARGASETSGRPVPPLTKAEAQQVAANFDLGKRQGALGAMEMLSRFGPETAAAAARQIAPDDPTIAVMVTLDPDMRARALDGREVLRNDREFLTRRISEDSRLERDVEGINARFAQALRTVEPGQRAAIRRTAWRIVAGEMDSTGGELTDDLYYGAINRALGAEGKGEARKGGLGKWEDNWFLLPEGVTSAQFGRAIRTTLDKSKAPPVNPDGSRVTNLRGVFPVLIGGGYYEFHARSGAVLQRADGTPWRVRVGG